MFRREERKEERKRIYKHITYIRNMPYPNWVLKHKRKGTEIRKIGNNFYLYKVTSVWDKERKRARKKSSQ